MMQTIGPKSRQRMIDNRAHFLMDDNPLLPLETARQISQNMQACYEQEHWDMFDLLREIATSITPSVCPF